MAIKLNMLGPFVEYRVLSNVDDCLITHLTGIGVIEKIVSSFNSLSQDNSATTQCMLLYSASTEDNETVPCFLDFQEIRLSPRNTTYPATY